MRRLIIAAVLSMCVSAATGHAQQSAPAPDLQGTWIGSTLTPLQRPANVKDQETFTPGQAAEYVRTREERSRSSLPTDADRLQQSDLDDSYAEHEAVTLDGLRTSLIVDPPNGLLPALLPAAQTRLAALPARSFEGPEVFNLAERCLLGNPGLGGSTASPPIVPNANLGMYYQIVQTRDAVLIFTEWIHDARIIRLNGVHAPTSVRFWLGDSIGHWEGQTLVVDTTNFRAETHNMNSGERLHVVERFTRLDAQTLRYRVTVEDPETWARPWTAEWPFRATSAPLFEVACHEGNYAIEHFLRGARAEEQRAAIPR